MPIQNCNGLIKKIQAYSNNPEIDLWTIDEVHFQQYGSRCRMWVSPETKNPISLHHPTRKSIGYFGAVRLRDGKFVYRREEAKFNAESFFSFIKHLRRVSSHEGRKVIVISDNARYHHATLHKSWRKKASNRFKLDFLPPYSPELNPIERVWKLVRRKSIHNKYFPTIEDLVASVEIVFAQWDKNSEILRKLCAIN